MRQLLRVVEAPRPCSYLEDRAASLEYRIIPELEPSRYADLLARGYRRFGIQFFRPACDACSACRSLRVSAPDFRLTRRYRRVLRRNDDVEVIIQPPEITPAHLRLYDRYHGFMADHRQWPQQETSLERYAQTFVIGGEDFAREALYVRNGELVGVALMDDVGEALSLVYFFYEPTWRPDSPGVFSVLTQIRYAQERGYRHVYLGYWIPENESMSYKNEYRPHEVLHTYPRDDEETVWTAPDRGGLVVGA